MSTILLEWVEDCSYAGGKVERITAPYGASVDLAFKGFSYKGQKPTSHAGIAWKLLIKSTRGAEDSDDSAALVDAGNGDLSLANSPLAVGYTLDTGEEGFSEYGLYYGELWADDTNYGKNPVKEFQIQLGCALRADFS